ncbi:NF-X1-type zinc finger protein NFXL1-like [Antedon mediterranea]|uniref:NF-X1-type zinc finger protein NFXL1-like n=1 Tax=Antedon mediterranea TaxID=105859 RepID=UPI003AF87444
MTDPSTYSFLGRGKAGRGRGRSRDTNVTANNISTAFGDHPHKDKRNGTPLAVGGLNRHVNTEKTREAVQNVQKHCDSSEDDDEDNYDVIQEATYKNYNKQLGLGATQKQQFHGNQNDKSVCLICIESVKREEQIWYCKTCYCILHLQCIQKWAREGSVQKNFLSEENFPEAEKLWHCPNCRYEYKDSECPSRYVCHCGKEVDPRPDPWLTPHTCGQTCSKPLLPLCDHQCLLLCHPGACPPCPKTVRTSCFCGREPPTQKRCSARQWSCGKKCATKLQCGHTCDTLCHAGECPPCPRQSRCSCQCGRSVALKSCDALEWQCTRVCGKLLSCGNHTCEEVCHKGDCESCPRADNRSCPCGKTKYQLPCTEDVPTCGDTCNQLLECGLHTCTSRCHKGPCEDCRQMTVKKCRCGHKEKSVPCAKTFLCDVKCSVVRNCGRHQCKRKCCDNHCPPCEQPCGRNLTCRNHKCLAKCHKGLCYPCREISKISCNCNQTVLKVRCGMDRATKPPRCKQPCSTPPNCHHVKRERHHCHFGRCPPCRQLCNNQLTCGHSCPAACHDDVTVKHVEQRPRPAGPWEKQPEVQFKQVAFPCPPCMYPVPIQCFGLHETQQLPCSRSGRFSCKRTCNRFLPCGNHYCQLECHIVTGAINEDTAGSECMPCEEKCSKPRPQDCPHKCRMPCHSTPCPTCEKSNKMRCHCRNMLVYVNCSEWTNASKVERDEKQSCKGPCPEMMSCGHLCSKQCHSGDCALPTECTGKKPLKCPCKRRKKNFPCPLVESKEARLECDDHCREVLEKQKKLREEEELKKEMEKQRQQMRDEEEYNRVMNKGKKHRRRKMEELEMTPWWKNKYLPIGIVLALALLFSLYLMQM